MTYKRQCIILAVDRSDVFPVDPAGVYPEFWGSLPGQLVPQCSPTMVSSEGCVVPPLLADVWRTVPGKQRRCSDYFDNSLKICLFQKSWSCLLHKVLQVSSCCLYKKVIKNVNRSEFKHVKSRWILNLFRTIILIYGYIYSCSYMYMYIPCLLITLHMKKCSCFLLKRDLNM